MHKKFYEGRTQHFFITTIGMAKTKRVSHPRLKPNGWIMIVQSILQVGVNSADSTEFTGPVEYPLFVTSTIIDPTSFLIFPFFPIPKFMFSFFYV